MGLGSGLTRGTIPFTHRAIEALRASEAPYRISDQRCIGLAVRVSPAGGKTWDLAFRIRGGDKTRRLSLGSVSDVPLERARERANELTSAARTGRDLIAEEQTAKEQAARRLTVADLVRQYVQKRVVGRLRTAKEIERRLKRSLASLLDRHAEDIRRRDLRELFDQCVDQGIPREAERRRQCVGAMFRWALSRDLLEIDPSAGLSAYEAGPPRDRVLDDNEIGILWGWLISEHLPPDPSDILQLQLLTGARCGEISGMRTEEFDRSRWIWVLPADRSKNNRPRTTPLLGLAKEIVERRLNRAKSGSLFASETGSVLTAAHIGHYLLARKTRLPIKKFTTHDLRRTVATHLVELGLPLEHVAALLGHQPGGRDTRVLVRHYIRSDFLEQKRHLLNLWDQHLSKVILPSHCALIAPVPALLKLAAPTRAPAPLVSRDGFAASIKPEQP
jgi:integrase